MSELKASDLRVGNLLQRGELGFVTVKRIIINDDDVLINEQSGLFTLGYNLTPIHLTEEILLKCGFFYDEDSRTYKIHNCTLQLDFYDYDEGFMCIVFGDDLRMIKYLHELQNIIYALTGKELKINI